MLSENALFIENTDSRTSATSIYNNAWKIFFEKYSKDIDFDVFFSVSTSNIGNEIFTQSCGQVEILWEESITSNAEINARRLLYKSYNELMNRGYKTLTFIHGDCFFPYESLKNLSNFINNNKHINLIMPINEFSLIKIYGSTNEEEIIEHFFKHRSNSTYPPWNLPYPGSGTMTITSSLLKETINRMGNDPDYLNSRKLSLNKICKELKYNSPIKNLEGELYSAGFCLFDFFTEMVKVGVNPAVIVGNDKRSCSVINSRIFEYAVDILKFDTFSSITDNIDITPKFIKDRVVSPYFHLGHSSHIERLIDIEYFKKDTPPYYDYIQNNIINIENIMYFLALRILAYNHKMYDYGKKIDSEMKKLINIFNKNKVIEWESIRNTEIKIMSIYKDIFSQYVENNSLFDCLIKDSIFKE